MSKVLFWLLLGIITIALAQSQETDIKVIVNYLGAPRLFSQVLSFSDLVYVPARELIEVLGATVVDEDPAAGSIILRSGGSVLFMQVDVPEILVNGQPVPSPALKRERGVLWAPVAALAQ
ncbi:MAG: hypothetical protein HY335_10185, partial [Deinococcus sp.]|nr:hypothetical protein [Deinococcus sp.]